MLPDTTTAERPISRAITLRGSGLWKYYGERAVVQNVTLEIASGEIVGLLGPNGAGKTTIVGMLYGGVIPNEGEVRFGTADLAKDSGMVRSGLGIVTQENNLDRDLTVFENLLVHAHHYGMSFRYARKQVETLLDEFDLLEYRDANVEALSGGLKRRLVLARALLGDPRIVLLDEPTVGFDPDIRQEFWRLIATIKHRGIGILLTTHYMDEAERLCDRLLLLQSGKVVDSGAPAELIERIAGKEVAEIEGVPTDQLTALQDRFNTWAQVFGSGVAISLPPDRATELWSHLESLPSTRLLRRRANLEDVFLRVTGAPLL